MPETLLKIFPDHVTMDSSFIYRDESLHSRESGTPYIYANLLASLDGRIAIHDSKVASGMTTPAQIRSALDWRLFCQLQAQADVVITHSGYLRSLASSDLGNILQLADDTVEVQRARSQYGLAQQPRVLVLSVSLDFDEGLLLDSAGSSIAVLTPASAEATRVEQLRAAGLEVVKTQSVCSVGAADTMKYLQRISAKNAYLQTGPEFIRDAVSAGVLKRLYLTTDLSLVGGDLYKSICDGSVLDPSVTMKLRSMYLGSVAREAVGNTDCQQLFAAYDLD